MTALVVQDHAHVWIELAHDRPPGGQGGRPTVGEDHGRSVLGATHLDVQECAVEGAYLEFAGLAHVLLRHRGYLLLGRKCLVGNRPSAVDFDVGNGEGRSARPVDRVPAPQVGGIESPVGLVSVGCADKDVANAAFVGPGDRLTCGQAPLPTVVAGEGREVTGQVCPDLHGDGLTFLALLLREDDLYGAFVFFFLVTEPAHGVFLL